MNGVFIIPTGIGCEIGGHAGDANPAVKLIASVCNKLVVNPNAVNASDINEMPDNCLYVEGSMIDRFLQGQFLLEEVRSNKILVVANSPLRNEIVNSVNAARATIGLQAKIVVLNTPLKLIATKNKDGSAGGIVEGWEELVEQVEKHEFDALAVTTGIDVCNEVAENYLQHGGVNPYGAVEANASKLISSALRKPVAHAPTESEWFKTFNEIVDPRLSAELVSVSYLHCILKGLWKAPQITNIRFNHINLGVDNIDFLITPYGCWGSPHSACQIRGIPIITVKENKTIFKSHVTNGVIYVENYLETVGVIKAMDIGIARESVRRPLECVKINEIEDYI